MEKHVADTAGGLGIVMVAMIIVTIVAICVLILMYNKRSVMKFNLANARIIETKNFAELYDVISSHEVRLHKGKLSDIIFTHFQKIVRKEFEYLKAREDYVEIVKLFDKIQNSYKWNHVFNTPLYTEFCSYILEYTKRLLDENQNSEKLFDNVSILDQISLELESFFGAKMYYKEQSGLISELRQKFYFLRRNISERQEGMTAGA